MIIGRILWLFSKVYDLPAPGAFIRKTLCISLTICDTNSPKVRALTFRQGPILLIVVLALLFQNPVLGEHTVKNETDQMLSDQTFSQSKISDAEVRSFVLNPSNQSGDVFWNAPPMWTSWWFRLLLVNMVLYALILFYLFWFRSVSNKNLVNSGFVAETDHVSHVLVSTPAQVMYPVEQRTPLLPHENEFIIRVVSIVECNLSSPQLSVDFIAREVGMSKSTLYRNLKGLTGQSAVDFIKELRMKKSLDLVKEGKLNISEIAMETGFNSPSYFTTSFKKHFGLNPSEVSNSQ